MAYEFVLYEKRNHIAYVTMNRPEVLNALHYRCHAELREVFEDFRDDPDSWVAIITGAGERAFSAGNDLKATAAEGAEAGSLVKDRAPFGGITSDFDCPKPIIAAVNGFALGGGFEIALACDIIVAAEHARFALPEPRVGFFPNAGGVHRLPQQIPLKLAMGMMLTGKQISAEEAHRIGLVNEVVAADELMAAAERWAGEIMECSPVAVRLVKEAALDGLLMSVDGAMLADETSGRRDRLFRSEDFVEGPKAFAEKRKPIWPGR